MKKKLQVFISSTYVDMLSERQAAVEAILRAGHIPAGMELFASGNESQWETICRWIDDSDVFLLILGGRYGSLEPKSGKSYIELEYEYAAKTNKPFFAAVISEPYLTAKVKANGPDAIERINGHLLQAFRETVTKKICRFFGDTNELKVIVLESLLKYEQNEGLVGWIRSNEVVDPKATLEEISQLQKENASLKSQIKDLDSWHSAQEEGVGSISDDAISLLMTAKNDNGLILYGRFIGGVTLQAGNRDFIIPENSSREGARWKAVLNELLEKGLIEPIDHRGDSFQVTKLGYDVADDLEKTNGQTQVEPGAAGPES